ncbi:hypothetical protein NLG97_g10854 [Lecanicillium saksenae]|uniref:Uncharacterized protein n=1 Tax=Lecanicillium saksenae TaxID=468837 RepID=A0ACC1QC75_9HYPO|nr:hypothetical protein NLG97_g10854 [Lecanicillium saksenae]
MLSFAPAPIFTTNWDNHRPAVSSPLSSSPLRASSPLGTQDDGHNAFLMRQTQSSPIAPPKFKYAGRAARPNPVMRRREDVQQQRRTNFLRSVRDKAEDKAWQRRDIEGQVWILLRSTDRWRNKLLTLLVFKFLKTNWIADMDRLSHGAPELSEADIEDASSFEPELMIPEEEEEEEDDVDDDMVDEYGDDAELEAMFASYHQQKPQSPAMRPISPSLSDDEYDDIFEELLSAKDIDHAMSQHQQAHSADQMDME